MHEGYMIKRPDGSLTHFRKTEDICIYSFLIDLGVLDLVSRQEKWEKLLTEGFSVIPVTIKEN